MLKVTAPKPYPLALTVAALLLACVTTVAQDASTQAATQQAATVEKSEVQEKTETPKQDAAEVASNDGDRDARRVEFDLTASRLAVAERAAKEATKDSLFVSDRFERQSGADPKPGSSSQSNGITPLTPKEKMSRAARNAFLNPVGYGTVILGAAITEATEEDLPHKTTEDRLADFATRFTIRFTTRATNTLLGSGVFPVLFKQDPRYHPSKSKNYFKRAAYAASRVFVTRDDDGNLEPNVSRWAGSFASSGIANLYEQSTPGRDRIGTDATLRRFASSFTSGMLNNIIREFVKL